MNPLLELAACKRDVSDLILALLRVWEEGEGPSFHVAYGRSIWKATKYSVTMESLGESLLE